MTLGGVARAGPVIPLDPTRDSAGEGKRHPGQREELALS